MSASRRMTRRGFLKSAGAAVAAPYVITSAALGADGRPAASDRIAMGLIGCGGRGRQLMGVFRRYAQTQCVAVCDVDARKRAAAGRGRDERGMGSHGDFRELLARDDIDAVVIATPNQWHAPLTVAAAKAGKDIYCEKPMSLTIRGARAAVNAVRRYGRVFQHGTQQRSDGRMRLACELVRSGRIGRLKNVEVMCEGPSRQQHLPPHPVPEHLDWDMWLGPAPWRPFNPRIVSGLGGWVFIRDFSGGGLTDWGAHHFDIAQWGIGADDTGPVEVVPPDGKAHPWLTCRYANGVTLQHVQGPRGGIRFTGTEGVVFTNRGHVSATPASLLREPLGAGEVRLYRSGDHLGNFLRCVRTRGRAVADAEAACRSVTIGHLANIAYWLARPLRWDPARERFIGDDEADRWLDRPRRAPWRL